MHYTTETLATAARTTPRGIRLWDERGLLGEVERDRYGSRVFTEDHLRQAKRIAAAQMCGLTLGQVRSLSDRELNSKADEAMQFLAQFRRDAVLDVDFDL